MITTIILSSIGTVISFFLISMIAGKIQKDFSNHLRKNDSVISLCIIFISICLLFLVGPFLTKIARFRATHPGFYTRLEEGDWFTFVEGISFFTVLILYILGIYTAIKLLSRYSTGRRLYYETIGIFIFAFWMFMIFGIVFWR
ncbi:hypothetical protein ES702_07784 [subsurface metagenome]